MGEQLIDSIANFSNFQNNNLSLAEIKAMADKNRIMMEMGADQNDQLLPETEEMRAARELREKRRKPKASKAKKGGAKEGKISPHLLENPLSHNNNNSLYQTLIQKPTPI